MDLGWTEKVSSRQSGICANSCRSGSFSRKLKDRLLLTPRGRKLAGDPEALWDFLANELANPDSDVKLATPLVVHWELTGDEPPYGS